MDDWQKKYEWKRTWPGELDLNGKPFEDYSCFDGQYAGRIRLELRNLKKGNWHWAGAYPKPMYGEPIMPNAGYCPTAAEAARTVEEYWDRMKALVETRKKARAADEGNSGETIDGSTDQNSNDRS